MAAPDAIAAATPAPAPTAEALRRARLFWEQGQADLKEAQRLLRARSHLESSYLSFQAALNALTCVCYLHAEFRVPNFSPQRLLAVLQGYEPDFARLEAAAQALEAAQALNPFAAERDATEEQRQSRLYYDHSDSILEAVRGYLRTHRRRFFSP